MTARAALQQTPVHESGEREVSGPSRRSSFRWLTVLILVWALAGCYEATHLKRGWVPWDAGAYAQSADRVLHGQLPHRDFVEVYTGGLTYLDAAAMRVFGENLAAERFMLFACFMAWIPAFYWIACQFCRDWIAGALVLLAVAWSVPNYSEAVPSWYNLFFATFGVAAFLAYIKRPAWKWLLVAGVCGGLSFLAKSVGLCYVGAVLLFFIFLEQSLNMAGAATAANGGGLSLGKRHSPAYTFFVFAWLFIFLAALVRLILPLASLGADAAAGEVILFVAPAVALCTVLVAGEINVPRAAPSGARFGTLFRMCVPFGIGVILPIFVFFLPYLRAHAMAALVHDLFAQASARIAGAHDLPDKTITIVPAIFLAGSLALSARLSGSARWILNASVAALLLCGLILAPFYYDSYIAVWSGAYWVVPVVVVFGGVLLARSRRHAGSPVASARIFLLLCVAGLCSLVQFPFSSPIYFCYAAPLAILALAALMQAFPRISRTMLVVLYSAFLIFMLFEVTPGFIYSMGFIYQRDIQTAGLNMPRAGGLRVDPSSAAVYNKVVSLIREHAGAGEIYAGPDCPEIYFLSGHRNVTPDIYDFLDPRADAPPRILRILANPEIRVVVVNSVPPLSAPLAESLREEIARSFPSSELIGHFEIYWRDGK